MIGRTLGGRYRIDRVLGEGGMGSVYAARDAESGDEVAIKVIHGNLPGDPAALIQRFEREARAASSVDTDHIARCYGAGTDPESESPFMVMELLEGEDLQDLSSRLGPLPPHLALRVAAQACLGLSAAHQAGIVHRDIKPANIYLTRRKGGGRTVKLLDFGVAKIRRDPTSMGGETGGGLTRTGSLLGSPLYMSPEQARSVKNVDHRSDIWSMGVVLYQAVAGRTPYEHISGLGDLIISLCSDLPPLVQQFAPWVEPGVAAVIDRALRIDPRERFQTAREMLEAVLALLPDGTDIVEEMLVPMNEQAKGNPAATYFRSFGGAPSPLSRMVTADTVAHPGVPTSSQPALGGDPRAATQSAVATTGPGLGATQVGANPQASRSLPMLAIAIACVVAGGTGVYAFTRPSMAPSAGAAQPAEAARTATATPPPSAAPPPTVSASAPVPQVAPAGSASAADSAHATPGLPGVPAPPASGLKPKPKPTGTRPDHSSYGDRK